MGQNPSKEEISELTAFENEEAKTINEIVSREGHGALTRYLQEKLDSWQNTAVKIGVAGRYMTGKSTFINKIIGLKPGQKGAAKSGSGNTTIGVQSYENPSNPKLILFDFPGVGSPEFPRAAYMNILTEANCDYFLIFFDAVISEDDVSLAENLSKIKIPFCFVRSKIDRDIDDAEYNEKDKSTVVEEIRDRAKTTMSKYAKIKNSKMFFISVRKPEYGEYKMLLKHMNENLSPLKYEAMVFSMSAVAQGVIEKKYTTLKARIRNVSLGAAAATAIPVPGLNFVVGIGLIEKEIKHYIKTFNFDKDTMNLPEKIKKKLKLEALLADQIAIDHFITAELGRTKNVLLVESYISLIVPIIGSIISSPTSFVVVYGCLSDLLENFRHDALVVYEYFIETQARSE